MTALQTRLLTRRYRRTWALRDCNLVIPSGRVVALVGPNGAGKTTLLSIAAGLLRPTSGSMTVLDGCRPGSAAARAGIGFVAQDAPLYRHLPAGDMVRVAANLSYSFDPDWALARLKELRIAFRQKVGDLSAGHRAQLALTFVLARRPQLLLLDEPMAALDPLARHEFMALLMAAVAEYAPTVVFSSHQLAELERAADYLIVLNEGRLQVAGPVDDLLGTHLILIGPAGNSFISEERFAVVQARQAAAQSHLLVRTTRHFHPADRPGPGQHPRRLCGGVLGGQLVRAAVLPAALRSVVPLAGPGNPAAFFGSRVSRIASHTIARGISQPDGQPLTPAQLREGLASLIAHHQVVQWTLYQPASRYHLFQFLEFGYLLLASALLVTAAVALVRRRLV